jgi:hypothetical protein
VPQLKLTSVISASNCPGLIRCSDCTKFLTEVGPAHNARDLDRRKRKLH